LSDGFFTWAWPAEKDHAKYEFCGQRCRRSSHRERARGAESTAAQLAGSSIVDRDRNDLFSWVDR
jgi:hypothetical protein